MSLNFEMSLKGVVRDCFSRPVVNQSKRNFYSLFFVINVEKNGEPIFQLRPLIRIIRGQTCDFLGFSVAFFENCDRPFYLKNLVCTKRVKPEMKSEADF